MLQAAGHAGSLKADDSQQGFILKPYDEAEARNYEALWNTEGDPLQEFVPRWGGVTEMQVGTAESGEMSTFMRIGNLLDAFDKPCVMDCKMGFRTFQEKEASNTKPRADLYKRLVELSPELVTDEEHKAGSITKFKWTQSRDAVSTSKKLGFRIDGIVCERGARLKKKELDLYETKQEVMQALPRLLPLHFSTEGTKEAHNLERVALVKEILAQMEQLRKAMDRSSFFKSHEFVGSSLLFIVDSSHARVHLIDLAKTESLPEGVNITHREEWKMGNHEDGMLEGVDKLIDCWTANLKWLEEACHGTGRRSGEGRDRAGTMAGMDLQWSAYEHEKTELERKLKVNGIDTTRWGTGGAKSMEELFSEVQEENAVTFEAAKDGRFMRVIDVIKAWILVDLPQFGTVALVEPKKRCKFGQDASWIDGTAQGKPLQKKVSSDQRWQDTICQAIMERLSVSTDDQKELFEWQLDTYEEHDQIRLGSVSDGYDGLWSKYRVHEIDIRVKDPCNPKLRRIGLPDGREFMTMNAGPHSVFGHRQHAWKWQSIAKAGYIARSAGHIDDCVFVKQIFRDADVERSGLISRAQFVQCLSKLFPSWPDEDILALFAASPSSAPDCLSYTQFVEWVYSVDEVAV